MMDNLSAKLREMGIELNVVDPELGYATYFTTSYVSPSINDGVLTVYEGNGKNRSWGRPQVTSDVKIVNERLITVYVVGWHKHTISPVGGMYYFINDGKCWKKTTANSKVVKAAKEAGEL